MIYSFAAPCEVSSKISPTCARGRSPRRGAKRAGRRCAYTTFVPGICAHCQVVVCVVADGRLKINPRTRSVLAALGVYQDGVGTNVVNGKPVVCFHHVLFRRLC